MNAAAHDLAQTLPPLLVTARQVAGAVMGAHGRRRAGPGETFWQFRPARPGDTGRSIDWRQSARCDRLQVRETEWAAAHTLHLWCDSSPTLDWRSSNLIPKKSQRAMVLALALSILLLRAGERVCPLGPFAPVSGERHLDRVALGLSQADDPLPSPLLSAHHDVILFSDFLHPPTHWQHRLQALAARGCRGHLVQILDPAELDFPFRGRIAFHGVDDQPPVVLARAQDRQSLYQARMDSHRQDLRALTQSLGWTHLDHRTDQPPQTALLALYGRLSGGR